MPLSSVGWLCKYKFMGSSASAEAVAVGAYFLMNFANAGPVPRFAYFSLLKCT